MRQMKAKTETSFEQISMCCLTSARSSFDKLDATASYEADYSPSIHKKEKPYPDNLAAESKEDVHTTMSRTFSSFPDAITGTLYHAKNSNK